MVMIQLYYILHLLGVLLVFSSLGGLAMRAMIDPESKALKKFGAITSGVGLFLILLGGFGLVARLYNNEFQNWTIAKIVIWVILGSMLFFINKFPQLGKIWWWLTLTLGLLAVLMVYVRPF